MLTGTAENLSPPAEQLMTTNMPAMSAATSRAHSQTLKPLQVTIAYTACTLQHKNNRSQCYATTTV